MWHVSSRIAVWQPCELLYTCYLPTYLKSPLNFQPRLRLIEAHPTDILGLVNVVSSSRRRRRRAQNASTTTTFSRSVSDCVIDAARLALNDRIYMIQDPEPFCQLAVVY